MADRKPFSCTVKHKDIMNERIIGLKTHFIVSFPTVTSSHLKYAFYKNYKLIKCVMSDRIDKV